MQEKEKILTGFEGCGKRIRAARNEKHLTQEDLAGQCSCNSKYLSQLENGAKPSLDMVISLSSALDKSTDYFLAETPYAYPGYLINVEISEKLNRCNIRSLQMISEMLDSVLRHQGEDGKPSE